jgi:hypothetical protein
MYAKNLSLYLYQQLAEPGTFEETLTRFEKLRGYGLLPRRREQAGIRLTPEQIASAVLAFIPNLHGWAGHVALVMGDLRPVGGVKASFQNAETLQKALAALVESKEACGSIVHATFCVARETSGDEYHALLMFEINGARQVTSYVTKMATSLTSDGAEKEYDHDKPKAASARQLVLDREFFKRLHKEVALSLQLNRSLETDWREYETEEELENFHTSLGARISSRYLNLGVDTQVTWPKKPIKVQFGGHNLVLFPKTKEHSHSISVDLQNENLSDEQAHTLINRFLSLLSWCDNQFAIIQDGFSGGKNPAPILRRNMAFSTAPQWLFNRSIPDNEDLLQRLAYYREGLNAHEASIVSFEVLSFFKVFEVRRATKREEQNPTKIWIADEFNKASENIRQETLVTFHADRQSKSIENYIFENNRVATAHTSEKFPSDADASPEIKRLYTSAEVMKALARHYITTQFKLSESYFSDDISDVEY